MKQLLLSIPNPDELTLFEIFNSWVNLLLIFIFRPRLVLIVDIFFVT